VAALVVTMLALAACGSGGPSENGGQRMSEPTGAPSTGAPSTGAPNTGAPSATATPQPPRSLAWGPTRDEYADAQAVVDDMSTEERAGQVIVATYQGTEPPVDLVGELGLGGVILMGHNIEDAEQIRASATAVQDADERDYPAIVAVDQEGGRVARVGDLGTEFPTYMTFGAAGSPDLAAEVARASGQELRALGFTMVFAPDADVTTGPDDPTIGSRSASSDPATVAENVSASLAGYADAGIVAVAKHFPGHGSVPADSHEELPVQTAGADELRERDFVPFEAAVDAGAPGVMLAHIDVRSVDPGVPSSMSSDVVDLLRSDVGFDGLAVTDAQDMAAVTNAYDVGEAAVRSLGAGADIVLMPADARAAHSAIVEAVEDGRLPAARLAEAATKGVAVMMHQKSAGKAPGSEVLGSHDDLSHEASLAGLTVVSGQCAGPLVGDSVQVAGGTDTDRQRFTEAARAAGFSVGSGAVVRLLGAETSAGSGDVVVALDTPYALGDSEASTAKIALYGRTPGAFRALAEVLAGDAEAGGSLPVDVEGVEGNEPECHE